MGYKEFCESVEHNVAKEQLTRILYVWRGLSSKGVFIIGLEKVCIHKQSKLRHRVIVVFWHRASTSIEQGSRDCGIVSVQEPVYVSLGPR